MAIGYRPGGGPLGRVREDYSAEAMFSESRAFLLQGLPVVGRELQPVVAGLAVGVAADPHVEAFGDRVGAVDEVHPGFVAVV